MTPDPVQPDITALNALSRLLARQVEQLAAVLETTRDPDVHALVVYAQASRAETLQRLEAETSRLGAGLETHPADRAGARPPGGGSDDSAIDEVARGEAELCIEFRKGVQNQALMPHTRHFLRDLLDRVTAAAERYGQSQH